MMRWLVPIDGSEHAMRAIDHVIQLASQLKQPVEVFVLNVQRGVPLNFLLLGKGTPSDKRELEAPLRAAGEKTLELAHDMLERAKITHSLHVEIGRAAETIAKFSKTYHCEMIVMSRRGLDAGESLLLGSVARKVVYLVKIPVLLVH